MDSTKSKPKGKSSKPAKPEKPRPDFPLFANGNGQWCRKIKKRPHYFGSWRDDPTGEAALNRWLDEKDALLAGREPRPKREDELTVGELINEFLNAKRVQLNDGELSLRSWRDYHSTCERIAKAFHTDRVVEDLRPVDFRELRSMIGKTRGKVALANEIGRVRVVFNFGKAEGLYETSDGKPFVVNFGTGFKKPSRDALRKEKSQHTQEHGKRKFEPIELRTILDALDGKPVKKFNPETKEQTNEQAAVKANTTLRAMVLLGINCGLGQNDCANLTQSFIDLRNGIINYPRPKTGVERRCPLWAETIEALRKAVAARPKPANAIDGKFIFLTKYGRKWVRTVESADEKKNGIAMDAVAQEFRKLLATLGINGKRGFYVLRHTFRKVADKARDRDAARLIMGHTPDANDMDTTYTDAGDVEPERLIDVSNLVHSWLFGDSK